MFDDIDRISSILVNEGWSIKDTNSYTTKKLSGEKIITKVKYNFIRTI